MILNEEYEVKVEKMLNEGIGLARINDIPVFIENACPDDVLKVKVAKINKRYVNAKIEEIIEPSQHRIKPVCSLHNVCGSCNWQHIEYSEQLKQKQNIVYETLKNIAGVDLKVNPTIASPKIEQYRCKVQYPVSQKKSGRIIAGYYKQNSHELVNIKYCPMQSPLINELLEFIKEEAQKLGISGYNEVTHSGCLRHVVFRYNNDLSELLIILVINSTTIPDGVKKLSNLLCEKYPVIKGICANFNTKKTNVILSRDTKVIAGNDYYIENLSGIQYKISANSFFQVNPLCAELIFDKVKSFIAERSEKPTILDAYSGVSSFGIWLSPIAAKVVCIEEVPCASDDAYRNIELNKCDNVEVINGDAQERFEELIYGGEMFDISVIDPPRKGCSIEAINNLIKLTSKYIIYVSCNVSTLARDMKILTENSFVPEIVQPVDMFPNTHHVETIVLFKKSYEKEAV